MEELAALASSARRGEPRLSPGRRAGDLGRRVRRAEAPQCRDRGALPRAEAAGQPLRAGRRRAVRGLRQGAPRPPALQPGECLRRGGGAGVRRPGAAVPEPAGRGAPRLHRRAEDRRPLALAPLRGGPPRHRRHPRRRRDRRERDAERPHDRRHPRAALRGAGHPRGARRVLHEPRRLRRPQRASGGGGRAYLRQPAQRRGRVAAPARSRRSPPRGRCTSSPMPGASSPSRWPTPRPRPSPGSRRSASRPTR